MLTLLLSLPSFPPSIPPPLPPSLAPSSVSHTSIPEALAEGEIISLCGSANATGRSLFVPRVFLRHMEHIWGRDKAEMTANLERGATFWGAAGPSRSRSRGRGNGIGRKQEGLWLDDCHLQLHTAGPLHVQRHEGWFNK